LPALDASLDAAAEEVTRWHASTPADEFATDAELPDLSDVDEEEEENLPSERVMLRPEISNIGIRTLLDPQTGRLHDTHKADLVSYRRLEHAMCPGCGAGRASHRPFRSLRLGGPFFGGVAGNVLLDEMPARSGPRRLPSNGRQLITFTDNRQGTARFAASWQQERERSFARARIWHQIQNRDTGGDEAADDEIKALEGLPKSVLLGPILARLQKLQADRVARSEGKPSSWADMQACLARLNDAEPELISLWRDRDAEFASPEAIARLQLLTEFLRRPLRANSLETMGFAALKFPALERQSGANVPDLFKEHGASLEDWRDFLHVVLTYFVRANSAVSITPKQALWLGQKVRPRRYLPWGVQRDLEGRREQRWPRLSGLSGRTVRPVLILRDAFELDLDSPAVRESVNDVLEAAWRAFSALSAKGLPDNALQLDLTLGEVVPVGRAWLCPVTGRIMERVFRGLTPYVTQAPQPMARLTCESIRMPSLPFPWLTDNQGKDERIATIDWLKYDPRVVELRSRGLWTDIADRLALLTPFARIVEHSAQQSSSRLREYEMRFKRGEINVLNCSTTMEMGVDIGGLAGVAMANVPPSPANYRQRVGRAGRRGEAVAVAFTYCSDTPLGWHTFDRPSELLSRAIAPPRVALESVVLTLRHVNAMLLGAFFRRQASQPLKLTAGAFFDHNAAEGEAPWRQFVDWLAADGSVAKIGWSGCPVLMGKGI
jgi:DEAD/DEAH box helicase domain-containing protein